LDELNTRFAPLVAEPERARIVRGVGIAVAQDWEVWLPECPAKDQALERLHEAVTLACDAAAAVPA
jgi:hypothetical protein